METVMRTFDLKELLAIFKFGTYIRNNFQDLYSIKKAIAEEFFDILGYSKEDVNDYEYTWHNILVVLPQKKYVAVEISKNFLIKTDYIDILKEHGLREIMIDEGIVFLFEVGRVIEVS